MQLLVSYLDNYFGQQAWSITLAICTWQVRTWWRGKLFISRYLKINEVLCYKSNFWRAGSKKYLTVTLLCVLNIIFLAYGSALTMSTYNFLLKRNRMNIYICTSALFIEFIQVVKVSVKDSFGWNSERLCKSNNTKCYYWHTIRLRWKIFSSYLIGNL